MSMRTASWPPILLASLAGTTGAQGAPPFPASFSLSSLNGMNGFVLDGIDAGDHCGWSIAPAGDINHDGFGDVVIGAPSATSSGHSYTGEAYVVFGGPAVGAAGPVELSALDGSNGFVAHGRLQGSCGWSVCSPGDINGDGIDDVAIGELNGTPINGSSGAGVTYVIFGRDTGVDGPFAAAIDPWALDPAEGFSLRGIGMGSRSGCSVAPAGDFNGDGLDDMIVGAFSTGPGYTGESYVVFGKNTGVDGPFPGAFDLSSLDGSNGFAFKGEQDYEWSGYSVSGGCDLNGDGFGDVIIGAPSANLPGKSRAGRTYVVFGGPAVGASGAIELSALDGSTGFTINGVAGFDMSGHSVSSAGDVNADGVDDLIIGSSRSHQLEYAEAGEAYVVFGRDTAVVGPFPANFELSSLDGANGFRFYGTQLGDSVGAAVSRAGDINHDGIDDVIIGARGDTLGGSQAIGSVHVVYGRDTGAEGPFPPFFLPATLDGVNGFTIEGIDPGDSFGWGAAGGEDFNGDGIDDLFLGALGADPNGEINAGECSIVFGRSQAPCAADVNGDGVTNSADFNVVAFFFGQSVPSKWYGDLTGDGVVNSADFNVLAGDFGCGAP